MSIVIKKNTVDISSSVDPTTFNIQEVLTKEVGSLQFDIKQSPTKATVVIGDQIDCYENGTRIFGGTVTEVEYTVQGILITTTVIANDWSFRLNSKLVAKNYAAMDPGDIVKDILTNFTDGTFTSTNVQSAGFNISTIRFNYELVTNSIEKLAKQIGWEWYVDPDKDVHFFPPDLVVNAPFSIDDTSGNLEWATLDIDQNLQNMKNSVFVIGGNYTKTFDASTTPDKYLTDGTKTVFSLAYPYDQATMTVTLAGVSQTIGTDQVTDPATVQVLYSGTSRFVRFTTVPTTGQTVKIYGNAQIPILAHVANQSAIDTYGEVQDAIIDMQIKSVEEAHDRANAQIAQYGAPVYTVKFYTLKTGLIVGQTININSVKFGIDIDVIIKRISASMYSNLQLRYEVECVGTEIVSFVDIMKVLLLQANASTVVNDSTVLQLLLLFQENIASTDVLNSPTTDSPPYKWGADAHAGRWNFFTWG